MQRIHKDRQLDIQGSVGTDLNFEGVREDLIDLLGNVTDNACKWAGSRVEIRAVAAETGPRRPFLDIIIEDDGSGVSETEIPLLFERGKRFDEHTPGTGLGLAIVRDVGEMYGGKVAASRSDRLGGLKVTLTLPAKPVLDQD